MKIIFTLSFPATTFSGVSCQKKKSKDGGGGEKESERDGEREKERESRLFGGIGLYCPGRRVSEQVLQIPKYGQNTISTPRKVAKYYEGSLYLSPSK